MWVGTLEKKKKEEKTKKIFLGERKIGEEKEGGRKDQVGWEDAGDYKRN